MEASAGSDWLEEAQKRLGRETAFEGVDEVTRNDIRRKLVTMTGGALCFPKKTTNI